MEHKHKFNIFGNDAGGNFRLCSICGKQKKGHGKYMAYLYFRLTVWFFFWTIKYRHKKPILRNYLLPRRFWI